MHFTRRTAEAESLRNEIAETVNLLDRTARNRCVGPSREAYCSAKGLLIRLILESWH